MNSIDLAIVANVGAVVCAIAVFLLAWPRYHANVHEPPVRIDSDLARKIREARQFEAFKRPRSLRDPATVDRLNRIVRLGDRRASR